MRIPPPRIRSPRRGCTLISAFLFWIIKDCLFLLGYLSGRQSFLKPLSPEEERAALLRMREGDETARQMLVEHNMRLIVHIARKYKVPGCTFDDLTVEYCQGFLTYMLSLTTHNRTKMMASTANNNLNKLKCVLRQAYEERRIKDNIATRLKHAKEANTRREFLTLEEVKMLANTPCEKPVVKSAALFSCLTGLRISDIIRLQWENIIRGADGGWCMHIVTKKTRTEAVLPLSDEALALCGERSTGQVFKGMTQALLPLYLKDWIRSAGITKHITFHCFRHTYATLQLAAGTDLYTISKMLTHSTVATTQVYADVVNDLKRKASEQITLK